MRKYIIASIIITLVLMAVCNLLRLGFFESILLMIAFFVIFNYRFLIRFKIRQFKLFINKSSTESQTRIHKNPLDGMEL